MPEEFGNILASWQIPEFDRREHTIAWYMGFGLIMLGLLIYAIVTMNFLFGVIIVLAVVIVWLQRRMGVSRTEFKITTRGLQLGARNYQYKDINNFWIIYEPPEVKKLYFTFKSSVSTRLQVPLRNQNPLQIREILLQFIPEDLEKEELPMSDAFAKWSKL